MAYQAVKRPRFIIDYLSWWRSLGLIYPTHIWNGSLTSTHSGYAGVNNSEMEKEIISKVIGLNPTSQGMVDYITLSNGMNHGFNYMMGCNAKLNILDTNIVGVLGHNIVSAGGENADVSFSWKGIDSTGNAVWPNMVGGTSDLGDDIMINCESSDAESPNIQPISDGFFLRSVYSTSNLYPEIGVSGIQPNIRDIDLTLGTTDDEQRTTLFTPIKIGSFIWGRYYNMPHSPDLRLTMTREMDGVKRVRTKGGADLVKHQYLKSPKWGDLAAWELHDPTTAMPNQALSRVGRRTWDLSFTLQESDVFPDVNSLTNYGTSGYSDGEDDITENTLLEDNSFFGQVIHKTQGLPFIFQPDKDYPEFAICKFDMNSFQFNQVANGVYNIKLKIREVW